MGLLVKLQTDSSEFKQYKFGQPPVSADRLGGGYSNQPYITTPINESTNPATYNSLAYLNSDFILRGGIGAPQNALKDVERLTKYMFDPKSPSGLLFIAKQNLLSRIAVKTEASRGPAYLGGAINEGVYTPLSTIAQAGVGFSGIHLNKQGIDPTGTIPFLGINKYEKIVSENGKRDFELGVIERKLNRNNRRQQRLTDELETIQFNIDQFYDNNTSITPIPIEDLNALYATKQSKLNNVQGKIKTLEERKKYLDSGKIDLGDPDINNRLLNLTYTHIFNFNTSDTLLKYGGGPNSMLGIGKTNIKFALDSDGNPIKTGLNNSSNTVTPNTFIYEYARNPNANIRSDFRIKSNEQLSRSSLGLLINGRPNSNPISHRSYLTSTEGYGTNNNIETLYGLGNPGRKGDVTDFTKGKRDLSTGIELPPADIITAYPLYKSQTNREQGGNRDPYLDDLIPFSIGILNNDLQQNTAKTEYYSWKKFMNFRAYIDSFSDSYGADWETIQYMGRAEKFYKYKGFSRDISLAFTVVAQSRKELNSMYDKLNFLASSLAPEYLDSAHAGYMAGNIAYITLGDYIIDQPGIITGFTYDIPEDASWELARDRKGELLNKTDEERKDTGYARRLPLMIKVTGFKFTPINKFRTEKVRWKNDGAGKLTSDTLGGKTRQKYIDPYRTGLSTSKASETDDQGNYTYGNTGIIPYGETGINSF